jgi:hypothetical protein
MSNHLHELMDVVRSQFTGNRQRLFISKELVERNDVVGLYGQFMTNALKAVSFYSPMDNLVGLTWIDGLCKRPFDVVWFETDFEDDKGHDIIGQLCFSDKDGAERCQIWRRQDRVWRYEASWKSDPDNNGKIKVFDWSDDNDQYLDVIGQTASYYKSFLSALNCTNINRIEHNPSDKLQKARAKRGKQPLFSYWTLEIDLPKSRAAGEDYGGTHASPRLHLRRGHPRQYAPGKYCWVQPCVVGNKAAGIVHKDYSVHV